MTRAYWTLFVLAALGVTLQGCSRGAGQWEITVENKGEARCSIVIAHGTDGSSKVSVDNVTKGKAQSLAVGATPTVIQSVRVVRGEEEETLTPKTNLPTGKRFAIEISGDGKATTSIVDR